MRQTESSERHILALDGLRGAAILLVFVYHEFGIRSFGDKWIEHAVVRVAAWGYSGVDLFFVLSGFLITRILLKTRDAENFYKVFYIRRVLRIFPLYYLAVALVFLVLPRVAAHHLSLELYASPVPLREQIWFWLNISNFRTAFDPMVVPLLTHFWSLAIEEQFYFIWPSVVRRISNRGLGWVCAGGILLPLTLRASGIVPTFRAPDFYYRITPFHMEGLFAGAVLALMSLHGDMRRHRRWFLAAIGVACLGIGCSIFLPGIAALQNSVLTFCALLFFGLVGLCLLGEEASYGLARLFSYAPLRSMGDYSYFMYIFHTWVLVYVHTAADFLLRGTRMAQHGSLQHLLEASIALLLLYTAGAISKRYFEDPILGLKRHFSYGRRRPENVSHRI